MDNKSGYIPYLDGCRALAISIVVLSHAGLGKIIPGKFGVTFFFFLSGFLITRLLIAEIKEEGRIKFFAFYLRRLFRLYPALLVMILCSAMAAFLINCPIHLKDVFAALFYYTNYYIGWYRPPVEDCARIFDILWSLSVEEHFYLLFPLFMHFSLKKNSAKSANQMVTILIALCILGIAIRIGTYYYFNGDINLLSGRIYFSSHTRMDSIIWGCLAAVILFQKESDLYIKRIKNKWVIASAFMALFLSVAIRNEFFRQTFLYSFQGYGLFILIPAIGETSNSWVKKFLSSYWMIYLGKISYSLYLFHWIALKLSNHFFSEFGISWQLFFWTLTILLSVGSYSFVEKPFIQLRKKFGSTIH